MQCAGLGGGVCVVLWRWGWERMEMTADGVVWVGMCGPLEMGRERMEIATGGVVQRWGQDWEIGF